MVFLPLLPIAPTDALKHVFADGVGDQAFPLVRILARGQLSVIDLDFRTLEREVAVIFRAVQAAAERSAAKPA